jgi:hypothetical protein
MEPLMAMKSLSQDAVLSPYGAVRQQGDNVIEHISEAALRHGLAGDEFWPALQPQLNLVSGTFAALKCWRAGIPHSMVVSLGHLYSAGRTQRHIACLAAETDG